MFFDTPFSSTTSDSRNATLKSSVPLKLQEVAEKIETGLELLGITGIEDKLQVGVPAPWPPAAANGCMSLCHWAPVGTAEIQGCH